MPDLDQALAEIVTAIGADSGTVHLLGEDGVLHLRAATKNIPAPVLEVVRIVPVGKGMAGLCVERNAPVDACNIQSDATGDVRPGAKATGLQGAIVVPMVKDGRAVGALGVANFRERTFTAEEITKLSEAGARMVRE